jgi:hypothetical protein
MTESLDVPKLDSIYSGIPERLYNEAVAAKEKTQAHTT